MASTETSSTTDRPPVDPARLAAVIEQSAVLLGLIDETGQPCYLSPAAFTMMTGRDRTSILDGDDQFFMIHPDDTDALVTAYAAAAETHGARVPFSLRTRHADGTWRHVEGRFDNALHDPHVRGVVISIVDVTDRVVAEQRLREQLSREAMLASIARDFLRISPDEIDAPIESALASMSSLLGAARASIFVLRGDVFERTHAWSENGPSPSVTQIPADHVLDFKAGGLLNGEASVVQGATLDSVTVPQRRMTRTMSSTVLAVALVAREQIIGLLSFGRDDPKTEWSDGATEAAEQFGALVTTALERRESERIRQESQETIAKTAERFRRLVQSSPDLVLVMSAEGAITYASPAAETMFGYTPDEVVGLTPWELIHPDDVPRAVESFARAVSSFQPEFVPLRILHKDGSWVPVETIGSWLFDDPVVSGLLVNVRDVRERERMAAELREAEARFRLAWANAPIGMGFADESGQFVEVNPAFCEMLGYSEPELIGQTIRAITHPDDLATNLDLHSSLYRDEIPGYSIEKRFRHGDGSWRWVRVTVTAIRDEHGVPVSSLGQVEDVTERRKFEERLAYEATHDGLTGLPLRNLLLDHLELAVAASRRSGGHVGVLFIDLDHFKRVNDSLGHAAGDKLLTEVAVRLRDSLRDGDTPGRFGGDEFVVVCPALDDPRDIVQVADRILDRLAEPFEIDGVDVRAGASIGIAVAEPGVDAETLLRQADTAAYRAKDHGRNRYEIFDAELRASVFARLQTEIALRQALANDELLVMYQPIVTAVTGELVGFEALVRWDRPGHGRVSPADFLPVAEDSGLIVPIGRHVLEASCAQLAAWQRQRPERPPFLAVNLSPRQLLSTELVDDVRDVLERSGVDAPNLWLELPETLLVHDTTQLVSLLGKLRDLGIELSLDDFGTGFSSLTHLRFLPVGVVKIDRTFIWELGRATQGATIVGAVISLAHALGMRVIAEGVETAEQLEILRSLNCDWIQGFYFSTPLLAAHATRVVDAGRIIHS